MLSFLKFEIEARLRQPPVFAFVEAVQPRRPVRHVLLHFIGFNEKVHAEHALAEVAFIQLAFEHQLVQMLQIGKRKLLRQQFESDGLIAQLRP